MFAFCYFGAVLLPPSLNLDSYFVLPALYSSCLNLIRFTITCLNQASIVSKPQIRNSPVNITMFCCWRKEQRSSHSKKCSDAHLCMYVVINEFSLPQLKLWVSWADDPFYDELTMILVSKIWKQFRWRRKIFYWMLLHVNIANKMLSDSKNTEDFL